MKNDYPMMLEKPDSYAIACSIGYNVLTFFFLPFILLLLLQGSFSNLKAVAGVEIAYHVINFLVAFFIFRPYLKESFYDVKSNKKVFFKTVCISICVIIAITIALFQLLMQIPGENALIGAYGILPLPEMELFALSSDLIYLEPLWGTLCMVLLTPFTVSCLYHAAVFAPAGNKWNRLCYVAMAIFLAIPRLCNALTFWPPMEELVLYLVQLPIHMVACRAYQKTDTVWAPITVLTTVNLLACSYWLLTFAS